MRNRNGPDHRPLEAAQFIRALPPRRDWSRGFTVYHPFPPETVLTSSRPETCRQNLFRYFAPTHAPRSRNGLSFSGSRTNLLCLLTIQLRQRCQRLLGFLRIAVFPICSR